MSESNENQKSKKRKPRRNGDVMVMELPDCEPNESQTGIIKAEVKTVKQANAWVDEQGEPGKRYTIVRQFGRPFRIKMQRAFIYEN